MSVPHTDPESAKTCADDVLARLAAVIESRKGADPGASYVARLLARAPDAILKKIGEEATETVMAAKDGDPQRIVAETADLWFHTLVMLAHYKLKPQDVLDELARREGLSGLAEKAARSGGGAPSALPPCCRASTTRDSPHRSATGSKQFPHPHPRPSWPLSPTATW